MNQQQFELVQQKYGKLIHKIGHWISGDAAISSHEDNTQDIWIAAMEASTDLQIKDQEAKMSMVQGHQNHQMGMMQKQEQHKQAMQQQKEKPKAKPTKK